MNEIVSVIADIVTIIFGVCVVNRSSHLKQERNLRCVLGWE